MGDGEDAAPGWGGLLGGNPWRCEHLGPLPAVQQGDVQMWGVGLELRPQGSLWGFSPP